MTGTTGNDASAGGDNNSGTRDAPASGSAAAGGGGGGSGGGGPQDVSKSKRRRQARNKKRAAQRKMQREAERQAGQSGGGDVGAKSGDAQDPRGGPDAPRQSSLAQARNNPPKPRRDDAATGDVAAGGAANGGQGQEPGGGPAPQQQKTRQRQNRNGQKKARRQQQRKNEGGEGGAPPGEGKRVNPRGGGSEEDGQSKPGANDGGEGTDRPTTVGGANDAAGAQQEGGERRNKKRRKKRERKNQQQPAGQRGEDKGDKDGGQRLREGEGEGERDDGVAPSEAVAARPSEKLESNGGEVVAMKIVQECVDAALCSPDERDIGSKLHDKTTDHVEASTSTGAATESEAMAGSLPSTVDKATVHETREAPGGTENDLSGDVTKSVEVVGDQYAHTAPLSDATKAESKDLVEAAAPSDVKNDDDNNVAEEASPEIMSPPSDVKNDDDNNVAEEASPEIMSPPVPSSTTRADESNDTELNSTAPSKLKETGGGDTAVEAPEQSVGGSSLSVKKQTVGHDILGDMPQDAPPSSTRRPSEDTGAVGKDDTEWVVVEGTDVPSANDVAGAKKTGFCVPKVVAGPLSQSKEAAAYQDEKTLAVMMELFEVDCEYSEGLARKFPEAGSEKKLGGAPANFKDVEVDPIGDALGAILFRGDSNFSQLAEDRVSKAMASILHVDNQMAQVRGKTDLVEPAEDVCESNIVRETPALGGDGSRCSQSSFSNIEETASNLSQSFPNSEASTLITRGSDASTVRVSNKGHGSEEDKMAKDRAISHPSKVNEGGSQPSDVARRIIPTHKLHGTNRSAFVPLDNADDDIPKKDKKKDECSCVIL